MFKKGIKEDFVNYKSVICISIPEKVVEKIILETISKIWRTGDWESIDNMDFWKAKPSLTDLKASYNVMTGLVDKRIFILTLERLLYYYKSTIIYYNLSLL